MGKRLMTGKQQIMHQFPRRTPLTDGSGPDASLTSTLAHHDAAIVNLSSRTTGVEASVKALTQDVHLGFSSVGSKLDKLESRPKFDFHQTVDTVFKLAGLFSLVVGGIIWVTTSQFSGVIAEQRGINASLQKSVDANLALISKLADRLHVSASQAQNN